MIRTTVDIAETKLRELIEAALRGEDVLIAPESGESERIIKLVAVSADSHRQCRRAGSARGTFWMSEDFDEPLEELKEYTE